MDVKEFFYQNALLLQHAGYDLMLEGKAFFLMASDDLKSTTLQHIQKVYHPHQKETKSSLFLLFDRNTQQEIEQEWHKISESFPFIGVLLDGSLFHFFICDIIDHQTDLEKLEAKVDTISEQLISFSQSYPISVGHMPRCNIVYCLGFGKDVKLSELQNLENRTRFQPVQGISTSLWFYDLSTNQLDLPDDFWGKTKKTTEIITKQFEKAFQKKDQPQKQHSPFHENGWITAEQYTDFCRKFNALIHAQEIVIPEAFTSYLNVSIKTHEKHTLQSQLHHKQKQIRNTFIAIGQEIVNHHPEYIARLAPGLEDKINQLHQDINQVDLKINQLIQYRNAWGQHQNQIDQHLNKVKEVNAQIESFSGELGAAFFKHERNLIEQDETLSAAFRSLLVIDQQVAKRKSQIEQLEQDANSWFSSMKAKAQILYLQGLNTKDLWSMKKYWPSVGKVVIKQVKSLQNTSPVYSLWSTTNELQVTIDQLEQKIEQIQAEQSGILRQVEQLSPADKDIPMDYPWANLEKHWMERKKPSEEALLNHFHLLGKSAYETQGFQNEAFAAHYNNLEYLLKEEQSIKVNINNIDH